MQLKLAGIALGVVTVAAAAIVGTTVMGSKEGPATTQAPVEVAAEESNPAPVREIRLPDQEPDRGPRGGRDRMGGFESMEARLAQFDANGDGIVDAEERQKMMEAMREERMKAMDKNGDGEIDDDERIDGMLSSPWGQRLARRFDANGDGVIDDAEREAIRRSMAEREQRRQDRRLEQFDADGDGVLSESEELAAREAEQARRNEWLDNITSEFDEDGDGELNPDERATAWGTMSDRREIESFVRRYDSDGDGRIDSVDFNAFLESYQQQDRSADVNRDGSIDALDVSAFRDFMQRSTMMP